MEFEQEKLLSIIREEAVKKIISENKKDVKEFLSIQEQSSSRQVAPQRNYLQGPAVRQFQGQLGLSPSQFSRTNEDFLNQIRNVYCDGAYGRVSSRASDSEKNSAINIFKSEVDNGVLGPYTHKRWELWVLANYGNEQRARVRQCINLPNVKAGLAEIYIDSGEQGGPSAAPTVSQVADNWEMAGRELGWTFGGDNSERLQSAIRATTTGVRNATKFMQELADPTRGVSSPPDSTDPGDAIIPAGGTGGFNPLLLIRASVKQRRAADRAAERAREDQDVSTTTPSGPVIQDTQADNIPLDALPRGRGEDEQQYADRRRATHDYLTSALGNYGTEASLGSSGNPHEIAFGGLMGYNGSLSSVNGSFYYLVDPHIQTRRPTNSRYAPLHQVFTSAALLDTYVTQIKQGFKDSGFVIGTNVKRSAIASWVRLFGWLAGRRSGGILNDSGLTLNQQGSSPNKMGRAGYKAGGEVYDAVGYILYKFSSDNNFDGLDSNIDLITAARAAEHDGGTEAEFESLISSLERIISDLGLRPRGQARPSTRSGGARGWDPDAARENTVKWREFISGTTNESASPKSKALSRIIDNAIKESFGVGQQSRSTPIDFDDPAEEVADSPEVETPAPQTGTTLRGLEATQDVNSIAKLRRFFNLPDGSVWDAAADSSFQFYFDQYYSGQGKPGLSRQLSNGWNAMSAYMASNNIASYPSGASGLLSFVLDGSMFRSQRSRIRRFVRENR